jgi:hypothetical protein
MRTAEIDGEFDGSGEIDGEFDGSGESDGELENGSGRESSLSTWTMLTSLWAAGMSMTTTANH